MRVLIIEDDQFYAQRISELLQDDAIEASVIQSAEEAIEADLTNCDGAIVDLMLPNNVQKSGITAEESRGGFLTGVAVARRLLKKKPGLRVVMLSSGSNAEAWKPSGPQKIYSVHSERGWVPFSCLGPCGG